MTLRERVLTNWHLGRIVRLAIGVMLLVTGIQSKDWITGSFSLWFLYQAFTDTGCCGGSSCAPRAAARGVRRADDSVIDAEEVK